MKPRMWDLYAFCAMPLVGFAVSAWIEGEINPVGIWVVPLTSLLMFVTILYIQHRAARRRRG